MDTKQHECQRTATPDIAQHAVLRQLFKNKLGMQWKAVKAARRD
jgi:hypothetical protein